MNPKNSKKSPIHENSDANITCDFGDGDGCFILIIGLRHVFRWRKLLELVVGVVFAAFYVL